MSIICQVRNEPWVHDLCAGDAEALARIEAGDWFSTHFDETLLQRLWNDRAQGASSPLLDWSGRHTVNFVASCKEGTWRCAHVRLPKGVGGEGGGGGGMSPEHQAVQLMLLRLGARLGEQPQLEYRFPDGQRGDVVWLRSKVCWEVDLTVRSQRVQERRELTRRQSGFRMVSLVDSKSRATSHADMERIRLWQLREQATRAITDRRAGLRWLEGAFVDNIQAWTGRGWRKRSKVRFADFVEELVAGGLSYQPPARGRRRHTWISDDDLRAATEQRDAVSAEGEVAGAARSAQEPVTALSQRPVPRRGDRRLRPKPFARPRRLHPVPMTSTSGRTRPAGPVADPRTQVSLPVSAPPTAPPRHSEAVAKAAPSTPPAQRLGLEPTPEESKGPSKGPDAERAVDACARMDPCGSKVPPTAQKPVVVIEQPMQAVTPPEPPSEPAKRALLSPSSAAKLAALHSAGWERRQQRTALLALVRQLRPSPHRDALIVALLRANHWTAIFDWLGRRRRQVAKAHTQLMARLPSC